MRLIIILAALPAVLGAPISTKLSDVLAPLRTAPDSASRVPNSYIVKFKDSGGAISALDDVLSTVDFSKGRPKRVFKNVFSGFTGKLDSAALKAIRKNPAVSFRLRLFDQIYSCVAVFLSFFLLHAVLSD
jgi:hypothetical protein